ncbi:MAG TPA: xanthine dehydrogenase family protein subunit M [Xanthobacteraceae bacterium]|nr:xanthine dehydrogenase family protein subunit M [Xanthobacteraceae bacterium]
MKPAIFRYHAPKTLDEAVAVLAEVAPDDGRVLAGGQSLVPIMAFRLAKPTHLVDINGIKELAEIKVDGGKLVIGACVRHAAFYEPVCEGPLGKLLATVVRKIAHHPIRTRGTFCGSVAHADPASEWCAVVATLDAEMVARSNRGTRVIAAKDYFDGIMTTSLNDEDILIEVRLPLLSPDTRVGFQEFSRRAGDFALSMAVVTYRLDGGKIVDARVGIGGAEPFPRRIAEAEAALNGKSPGLDAFQAAGEAAAAAVEPLEDIQISADYRRDLVLAMTRRALDSAAA